VFSAANNMKLQNSALLTPAQQRATKELLGQLPARDVFVLRSAAGMGRTTVLQRVHHAAGGVFLTVREFIRSLSARRQAAIEEAFLDMLEQAVAHHQLVIVDDLHLVANPPHNYLRSHLLDAALTGIMGEASAGRKKLVFGVQDEAPWPVSRRAYYLRIE
jgi:hypothetical protein